MNALKIIFFMFVFIITGCSSSQESSKDESTYNTEQYLVNVYTNSKDFNVTIFSFNEKGYLYKNSNRSAFWLQRGKYLFTLTSESGHSVTSKVTNITGDSEVRVYFEEITQPDIKIDYLSEGYNYFNGQNGYGKDIEKAYIYWKKAANQGNAEAQTNLGWMYETGTGVIENHKEAVRWYEKAANQGNAEAQTSLGWMYETGTGVIENHKEAVRWYEKAANQGNAYAQANLGGMYLKGLGVNKNLKIAAQLIKLSADQGNSLGQAGMGWLYQKGLGVDKDIQKATYWYELAAEQGDSFAQNALGEIYVSDLDL
ncbi:tetratricopeptide repeat protein [Vibrio breoganii]